MSEPRVIEARVRSLDELLEHFKVDLEDWEVDKHVINTWEVYSSQDGIQTMHQVKAWLLPKVPYGYEVAIQLLHDAKEDLAKASPKRKSPSRQQQRLWAPDDRHLLEVAIFDPHIGLYAWEPEVGADYDSKIAVDNYMDAVVKLAETHKWYNTDRILFPIGNDLLHVDHAEQGKGGNTTRGTAQDVDTRLKKMFVTARRATVNAIEYLREIANVDVIVVPGNHDEERSFMLGDVVEAWFRNDKAVTVNNDPILRKYYQYGKVLLGFTHGMEAKRQRDNLPLIMSTEAPPEMWASTKFREWHTGHNHTRFEVKWLPQWEERGIRVRSLPAIVPEDSWHFREGYQHQRSAECLVWNKEKGFTGLHSFNIT